MRFPEVLRGEERSSTVLVPIGDAGNDGHSWGDEFGELPQVEPAWMEYLVL